MGRNPKARPPSLVLIGASVRGTAALGRLAARLTHSPKPHPLELHIIDPHPPGSGRIWRDAQPQSLVMNTVAGQSTVFSDGSCSFSSTSPGPSLAKWCELVTTDPEIAVLPENVRAEAADTRPWSSPSRLLYGFYLRWAFTEFASRLPAGVTLRTHTATASRVERRETGFRVHLERAGHDTSQGAERDAATFVDADTVMLNTGWSPSGLEAAGRTHADIGKESPIDQNLDRIRPGERVAVRGLGMGFFDLLNLVTEHRGGRFEPAGTPVGPEDPSGQALHYQPSGREPLLFPGSRSGAPFLAKPDFRSVPPAAPHRRLRNALPSLVARRPVDFGVDVWPLIWRDATEEYLRTLARVRPEAFDGDPAALLSDLLDTLDTAHPEGELWRAAQERALPRAKDHFNLEAIRQPLPSTPLPAAELRAAIRRVIAHDAAEAALGHDSPRKVGLHSLQSARAAALPIVTVDGLTPTSYDGAYREFLALATRAGSGPPLFRVWQLLAAIDAGVVHPMGSGLSVSADNEERSVHGALFADPARQRIDRVVDARLSLPVPATSGSLWPRLYGDGLARDWRDGDGITQPTAEVDPATSALVGRDGVAVPGLFSCGLPHERLLGQTIIAPLPGCDSSVLRELDIAAKSALRSLAWPLGREPTQAATILRTPARPKEDLIP